MRFKPNRLIRSGIALVVLIGVLGACSSGDDLGSFESDDNASSSRAVNLPPSADQQQVADTDTLITVNNQTGQRSPAQPQEQPTQQRIILRNASITVTVDDVAATVEALQNHAIAVGGWVLQSNLTAQFDEATGETSYGTASVSFRVPATGLDATLVFVRDLARYVSREVVTGEDVTATYVDLSSELTALRAAETRLQQLVDEATDVDGVLAVLQELERIRTDIETIEGRLRFYDESAAFSRVEVDVNQYRPTDADARDDDDGGGLSLAIGDQFRDGLYHAGQLATGLGNVLAFLIGLVGPFAPLVVVAGWGVRRWHSRRPRRVNPPTPQMGPSNDPPTMTDPD